MVRSLLFPLVAAFALAPLQAQAPAIHLAETLDFGILLVDSRGGMIALTELGLLIPTGPGVQTRAGATAHAARLQIQGKPGAPFSLRLDPVTPFLEGPRGARIPMNAFICQPSSLAGTFDAEGKADIRLGGRLDLRSELPAGTYQTSVRLQVQTPGQGPIPLIQSFQVQVRLQGSFKLTCLQELDFGALVPGSSAGVFEVRAAGGHQKLGPGGPTLVKGRPSPAQFLLEGQTGAEYCVQMPARITLSGPGRPLTVGDFHLDGPSHGFLLQGFQRFSLGARILVPPDQAPGGYRGILHVTVAYL